MDLNTILIIAGVIVLIGLVAHGLWANRREKSKYFESANAFERDVEQNADMQQYAQTVNRPAFTESPSMQPNSSNHAGETVANPSFNLPPNNPQPTRQPLQFEAQPEYGHPSQGDTSPLQRAQPAYVKESQSPATSQVQMTQPQSVEQIKITLPESQPAEIEQEPLRESSYYAQTEQNISTISIAEAERFDEEEGINTSSAQLRIQLQEAAQEPLHTAFQTETEEPQQNAQAAEHTAFITLYVVAAENRTVQGIMLEQTLEKLGFKLGLDKLYHTHLNLDETAPVLFSVANIKQPGAFEQNHIFEFSTQGIVLFMRLPSAGNDRVNLKMMIRAAHNLADELNGFVLTEQQELFTREAEAEYLARLD